MDEAAPSRACQRVEEVLHTWHKEAEEAKGRIADQMKSARTQLDALADALRTQAQTHEQHAGESLRRISELSESLASGAESVEGAKSRIADLERELAQHADAEQVARTRIETLERELAKRDEECAALQEKIEQAGAAAEELAESAKALESAEMRLTELEGTSAAHAEAVAAAEARAAEAAEECETLREKLAAADVVRSEVEAGLAEAKESASEMAEQVADLEARCKQLESENGALKKRLDEVPDIDPEQLSQLEETVAELRQELADAQSAAGRSDSEAKRLAEALEDATAANAGLKEEASRARSEMEAAASRLKDEQSKGAKAALAAQLADALTEQEQMRTELEALRARADAAPAAVASMWDDKPEDPFVETDGPDSDADEAPDMVLDDIPAEPTKVEAPVPRGGTPERDTRRRQLGEILVRKGVLSTAQLEESLDDQIQQPQRHIGALLIEKGYARESDVAEALSEQCKVEVVRISDLALKPDIPSLISPRLAALHTCIPIGATETSVTLAMDNPLNLIAIEDVERATGRMVETVIATASDIRMAHERYYAPDGASTQF